MPFAISNSSTRATGNDFGVGPVGRVGGRERFRPDRVRAQEPNAIGGAIGSAGASSAERLQYRSRESQSAKLQITTAEGDRVTLSFQTRQSSRFDAVRAYGPNGQITGVEASSQSSTKVSVKLEGNLSDQEIADITALITKLTGAEESGPGVAGGAGNSGSQVGSGGSAGAGNGAQGSGRNDATNRVVIAPGSEAVPYSNEGELPNVRQSSRSVSNNLATTNLATLQSFSFAYRRRSEEELKYSSISLDA